MHQEVYKVLNGYNIAHKEIRHDSFDSPINSPVDFACALNYDLERITKSVFLRSKTKDKYVMAVCSMGKKLDFAKLALLAGVNKLEVAEKQELDALVGYPINGVCAISLSNQIQVFIDEALLSLPSLLTGSGEAAIEIELLPADLLKISHGTAAIITL